MTVAIIPYRSNPQRRLRRLRRILIEGGGLPCPPHAFDDHEEGSWADRWYTLVEAEFEWACKVAMESLGGKW